MRSKKFEKDGMEGKLTTPKVLVCSPFVIV